ncbi:MAG: hypothetical protein Satyrvirus18_1, partial [Satyrvirus sp.]
GKISKYPYQIVKLNIGQSYKFKEAITGSFYIEGLRRLCIKRKNDEQCCPPNDVDNGLQISSNILQINFNDDMLVYSINELENEEHRIKILSSNCNFCVVFCIDDVIDEIASSYIINKSNYLTYESKNNILKQLMLDFPRMEISINSIKCTNFQYLLMWLSKFKGYYYDRVENVYYLLMMLCTQTSFYYSYNVIQSIYSLHDMDIHVISSSTDRPLVNITDNGTSIDVTFKKIFNYSSTFTNKVFTKFHTYFAMNFDLTKDPDNYFRYGRTYAKNSSAILYWVKENDLLVI